MNRTKENDYSLNIDNSNIILQQIKELHTENLMTDVDLIIGGKDYPAHRLILCASSDVFQVMLMKPEWEECHRKRIVLQESEECCIVFQLFLDYFYSGQIILNYENVMPLLLLADKYNVKNLVEICAAYMCSNVPYAASQSVLISWLQYASVYGHNEVAENCHKFIKWNIEYIATTNDFGSFDLKVFCCLLQESDLVVKNEMTLYTFAVKWLSLQEERLMQEGLSDLQIEQQMASITEEVMSYIRFPMMTPRQLAELLLSPLVKKYKGFFVERMAIGMSFHSGQEDRIAELSCDEIGRLLFTPRLYTSDKFGADLMIDNFLELPNFTSRTFLFFSNTTLAEYRGKTLYNVFQEKSINEKINNCEWLVEVYAKGVWFKKFFLLSRQRIMTVLPEYILPTVRLALTCKHPSELKVKIVILVYGEKADLEHVVSIVEKIHTFTPAEQLLNVDNVIPYNDLNPTNTTRNQQANHSINNGYILGSRENSFKMHLIVTPLK